VKQFNGSIALFLLLIFSVVLIPASTFHHHDTTHDTHFFDDSHGLISDHVFEECDFCTVVIPHFFKIEDKSLGQYSTIVSKQFLAQISANKQVQFSHYFLRGPPAFNVIPNFY
jgi:hypothetical protein